MSHGEFEQWLYEHHDHLRHYHAWEVARLALAVGFTMDDLAAPVSSWLAVSQNKLALMDSPFMGAWADVTAYQRRGKLWDSL